MVGAPHTRRSLLLHSDCRNQAISLKTPAKANSPSVPWGCSLLKKENVSDRAGYPDDHSTDELDPNRVRVPNLVVKENSEQYTTRNNQRPSEFHDATIPPGLLQSQAALIANAQLTKPGDFAH
jgi:hypothetical protein